MEFVGKHCAVVECRVKDFLPFRCSLCQGDFCLEHRQPAAHACRVPPPDNQAIFCPRCKQQIMVRFEQGEDPQVCLAKHAMSGCKIMVAGAPPPAAAAAQQPKQHKPRCSVPNCRVKMSATMQDIQLSCALCKKSFCLTHRAPDAHECQPVAQDSSSFCVCQ